MRLEAIPENDLSKLKTTLGDLPVTNETIERFYLAMEGDMNLTESKIKADYVWRENVRPDQISVPSASDPDAPIYVKQGEAEIISLTKDTQGCPLLLIRAALHDGNLFDEKFKEFMIAMVEQGLCDSSRFTVIFDMNGIGWRNVDFGMIRFAAELFNDHYPERLKYCLILRPPMLFTYVFRVAKRFLGNRTIPRIHMIESRKDLEKFVEDVDKLPKDVSFVIGESETRFKHKPIETEDKENEEIAV